MNYLFTSESVTKGHPDKICDQISDGILDELLRQDPYSRCACETTVCPSSVHIMGEITTKANVDYIKTARKIIRDIGYTKEEYGFTDKAVIRLSLHEQSEDIALGVDSSFEDANDIGAGDQGMMFGYACSETGDYMPLSLSLARKLTTALTELRENSKLPYLRPDGKAQVTVEYDGKKIKRLDTVIVSAQHNPDIRLEDLRSDVKNEIILKTIPSSLIDKNTKFYINPTGRFIKGGPAADTGLTGRKIIVDTYGGVAHHGGGAFSGKDATKVDRSGAYALRNIAKTIVASGVADECEIQISYAIGVAKPISLFINTFDTLKIPTPLLYSWVHDNYDLRPARIIKRFDLRKPIYLECAEKGHFGGNKNLPWEMIDDKALSQLKSLL